MSKIIDATWNEGDRVRGIYPPMKAKVTDFQEKGETIIEISPQMVHAIALLCGVDRKIDAIKLLREVHHCHLGSAKNVVDEISRRYTDG